MRMTWGGLTLAVWLGLRVPFGVAIAQEVAGGGNACVDVARLAAVAGEADAEIVHDLRGEDATRWLAAYNAIPPVTAIAGDQVVLVERAGAPTMLVVVMSEGCATAAWQEGRELVRQVTDRVVPGA